VAETIDRNIYPSLTVIVWARFGGSQAPNR